MTVAGATRRMRLSSMCRNSSTRTTSLLLAAAIVLVAVLAVHGQTSSSSPKPANSKPPTSPKPANSKPPSSPKPPSSSPSPKSGNKTTSAPAKPAAAGKSPAKPPSSPAPKGGSKAPAKAPAAAPSNSTGSKNTTATKPPAAGKPGASKNATAPPAKTNATSAKNATSPPPPKPRSKPSGPTRWTPPASDAVAVDLVSKPGLLFQYQTSEPFDLTKHVIPGVRVYFLDAFLNDADTIKAMKDQGLLPICFFSAGIAVPWRPDFENLAEEDMGSTVGNGTARYLNIKRDEVKAWVQARIDLCKEKGFIGIQPGDTDLHTQKTGFDFTPQDIRTYLAWLSAQGKAAGMGVGLTNTLTLIDTIVAEQFDWAVNSNCFEFLLGRTTTPECALYAPFAAAGKPIYQMEFANFRKEADFFSKVCPRQATYGLTSIYKDAGLGFQPWLSCKQA